MTLSHMMNQFGKMKHYFIACCCVFVVGIVLGYGYSDQFQSFIQSMMKALDELAKSVATKENPQASLFWLIFWNNVTKSLQIIALGIFFGVIPLFFLLTNGLLLGYIASIQVQKDSLLLLIKGILPHGIIEIPAIILASALGLRLGVLIFKTTLKAFSPLHRSNPAGELKAFILALVPACLLLVVCLLIAAIIESTFTFWLIKL
ncbi:stage II sporulation protein M [Paenibacillus hamazuiensis]|uniref:stage II sporulation protein M n=1 Tax=Paenibacillus hamazuiensis TaxID=2936508 RepID=UPI00200FB39E|nr:stage II sporulation protein M [Paenibacillus hamazuiensis]